MIVDTSALLAILLAEPEALQFTNAILSAESAAISAASYLEAAVRIDRLRNPVASRMLDKLIETLAITIEPVNLEQIRLAREANRDFGKGMGHPAQLNFGDCFAYALAKTMKAPLLFKGNDFSKTDLTRAAVLEHPVMGII
jgi:ribonuclease VapC